MEGDLFGLGHKYYGVSRFAFKDGVITITKLNGDVHELKPNSFSCSLLVDGKHHRRFWTFKKADGKKFKIADFETLLTKDQYDAIGRIVGSKESGFSKFSGIMGKIGDITG